MNTINSTDDVVYNGLFCLLSVEYLLICDDQHFWLVIDHRWFIPQNTRPIDDPYLHFGHSPKNGMCFICNEQIINEVETNTLNYDFSYIIKLKRTITIVCMYSCNYIITHQISIAQ